MVLFQVQSIRSVIKELVLENLRVIPSIFTLILFFFPSIFILLHANIEPPFHVLELLGIKRFMLPFIVVLEVDI